MTLEEVPTPALALDFPRVRRNASDMLARIHALGSGLRPHVKTHKCLEVAAVQTEGPHGPITVSTVAEARAFAAAGYADITYAVPIEPGKFADVLALARTCERLTVLVDDLDVARQLGQAAAAAVQTLDVMLKVDCGYHRCGVAPDAPEAESICTWLDQAAFLRFRGLLTHAGQSYACRTDDERRAVARLEREAVAGLADRLRAAGVEVPVVSVGSTPSLTAADDLTGVTEARPGNYIFFDGSQVARGTCTFAQCALTVLAAVVHRDVRTRRIVVDAGSIAMSKDAGVQAPGEAPHFGHVLDLDGTPIGARLHYLAQEHGVFTCPDDATCARLRPGTRVRILPNHACLTVAQHPHYHVMEGGRIVARWTIHPYWH